jgi:hypothetical protein
LPSLPAEAGDGLSPAQRLALASILAGSSFCMAARAAGVDRRTVYRWRQEPAFKRVLDEIGIESMTTLSIRIRNLMLKTTRVLSESVGDGNVNAALRIVGSARVWAQLKENMPKREHVEIERDDEETSHAKDAEKASVSAKPQTAEPLSSGTDDAVETPMPNIFRKARKGRVLPASTHAKISSAVRFPLDVLPDPSGVACSGAAIETP